MLRPAVAAAIAVQGAPTLMYAEALAAGLGSPRDTAWIDAVFTSIQTEVRGRKKPGKPRRAIDDEGCDLLAFALEGAALWHAAVEADLVVTAYKPKANERRSSPWASMFAPKALLSKRFAALPNPYSLRVAVPARTTTFDCASRSSLADCSKDPIDARSLRSSTVRHDARPRENVGRPDSLLTDRREATD